MPYSVANDMLVEALALKPGFDKDKYVTEAAEEMDSKLGWVYSLPLRPEGVNPGDANSWEDLPAHQVLLLKSINNRLASGRLIMAMALPGENDRVNAYGQSLVTEALADLMYLANQELQLDAEPITPATDFQSREPVINNHDDESLLDAWENTVMRGVPSWTMPGEIT